MEESKLEDRNDSMSSFEHVQLGGSSRSGSAEGEHSPSHSATEQAAAADAIDRPEEELPATQANTATAPVATRPPAAAAAKLAPAGRTAAAAAAAAAPAAALGAVMDFFAPATSSQAASHTAAQQQQKQQGDAEDAGGDTDKAAATASGGRRGAGVDPEVDEFEAEVMKGAMDAAHAVEEVGQKLLHGAAEAKESLASLASGLTSWWSNFDPVKAAPEPASKAGGGGGGGGSSRREQDVQQSSAQQPLEVESGETVLESFACQLLQAYTATNNFFTPVKQVPFAGTLHVTSLRLCFTFDDRGVAPIKLPGKAIKAVAKLAADAKQGLPERLEIQLGQQGQSLVLTNFSLQELEMDSALALVEHLGEL